MNKTDIANGVRAVREQRQRLSDAADPTLQATGLNVESLIGLIDDVATGAPSTSARSVGRLYHLHGWDVQSIALMAAVDPGMVEQHLSNSPRSQATRQVLELHQAGLTPLQIHEKTGIQRGQVYRWLEEAGVKPHRLSQKYSAEQRQRIIDLYESGASYNEIAVATGLERNQVVGVVRNAAARGECPNYGSRA